MPSAVMVQLFVSLFYALGQALLPFSILSFSPKALGQFTDLVHTVPHKQKYQNNRVVACYSCEGRKNSCQDEEEAVGTP